jgi:molybdenum cofactor synthesis domain-containing protein
VLPYHLLHKTELRIEGISLQDANLTELAAVVADTLSLDRDKVLVIDVRHNTVALDILQESVDAASIVGKQEVMLRRLAALPGVEMSEETAFSSDGMLGWIALDAAEGRRALQRSEEMAGEIRKKLARRAVVFSTGGEVVSGQIRDTNTPTIAQRLEAEGYSVARGATLCDDGTVIAASLSQAICDDGYGLVITTGGTGAEDKDRTIEAVLALDAEAATPYICTYEQGVGRHHKDGVRIGVGRFFDALIVALPGPNDEVKASLDVLISGLRDGRNKRELAEDIAGRLRAILRQKMIHQTTACGEWHHDD